MYETRGRRSAFVGNPQPCGLPQANTWGSCWRLEGRPREQPLGFGFVLPVTRRHHPISTLLGCHLYNMTGRQLKFGYFFFWSWLTQSIRFSAFYMDRRIRCAVTRAALEELSGSLKPLRRADLERIFEQHRQEIEQIAAEKILAGHFLEDSLLYVRAVDLSSDAPRRLTLFPHI